jgi:hypothetical protein
VTAPPRHLLTVEDAFQIKDRGTIVVPDLDLGERRAYTMWIELRRPDGSRERLEATASIPFVCGPNVVRRPLHTFQLDLPKDRVPIGTELWTADAP